MYNSYFLLISPFHQLYLGFIVYLKVLVLFPFDILLLHLHDTAMLYRFNPSVKHSIASV